MDTSTRIVLWVNNGCFDLHAHILFGLTMFQCKVFVLVSSLLPYSEGLILLGANDNNRLIIFALVNICLSFIISSNKIQWFLAWRFFSTNILMRLIPISDIDDGCRNAASAKSIIIENREYRAKHNSTGQHRFLTYKIGRIFIHNENIGTMIKCHQITSKSESPTENIFSPFLKVGSIIYNKVRKSKKYTHDVHIPRDDTHNLLYT